MPSRYTCSSATFSVSWLVARRVTLGASRRVAAARVLTASTRCSQLSNTKHHTLAAHGINHRIESVDSITHGILRVCATLVATRAGSLSAASSISQTPSSKRSRNSCATARPSRVLPIPPGPTIEPAGVASELNNLGSTSTSRPYSGGNSSGRLLFGDSRVPVASAA